ncbi:uncharacterized protein LOC120633923 isoform X2 [Pararge aegeria]|uniref:uncharacterized protein LOC120633923 isoform X2 n=1 Tax=Pararge aegeria TaxID=116150 RepID=UPI0019D03F37|nr:uncharacterized protein LOC120633923 isoform X2 [Pararge aegeria]
MCSIIQLPLDILINILARLELRDLRNLMLTCRTFKNLILNENSLWRIICSRRLILQKKSEELSFSWYNKCRISYNWSKGIYRSKMCSSQTWCLSVGSELRCYLLHKKYLISSLLWSVQVPTIKRDDVRTNDISRFIVKDDIIVCGNRDGCATVYKWENAKQKPNLLMHIKDSHDNGMVEVSAVEKMQDIIVTASNNCPYICFWDCRKVENNCYYNDKDCKTEYKLKNEIGCRSIAANDVQDKLALGLNGNSKPLLLDVNTGSFLMTSDTTRNVGQVIRDIQWHDGNCIAYVTHSGKLRFIDIRSSALVYEARDPFQSSLYCLKTDSDRAVLVGSSEYSRCVLFDLRSTHVVQMYFTQKKSSPIYSLDFASSKLIAAADLGVACLNFNVNAATTQMKDFSYTFEFVNR